MVYEFNRIEFLLDYTLLMHHSVVRYSHVIMYACMGFLIKFFQLRVLNYVMIGLTGLCLFCGRTRQASITTELIEIISGASALEG